MHRASNKEPDGKQCFTTYLLVLTGWLLIEMSEWASRQSSWRDDHRTSQTLFPLGSCPGRGRCLRINIAFPGKHASHSYLLLIPIDDFDHQTNQNPCPAYLTTSYKDGSEVKKSCRIWWLLSSPLTNQTATTSCQIWWQKSSPLANPLTYLYLPDRQPFLYLARGYDHGTTLFQRNGFQKDGREVADRRHGIEPQAYGISRKHTGSLYSMKVTEVA